MTTIIAYVFLIMTILGFGITVFDRIGARVFKSFRIPEKILYLIACFLGAFGVMLGLFLAKRDLYQPELRLRVPAIAVGEVVLLFWMIPNFFEILIQILGV